MHHWLAVTGQSTLQHNWHGMSYQVLATVQLCSRLDLQHPVWLVVLSLQVLALAAELEEALLQLSVREQILDQVWSQLKGMPQYARPAAAPAASCDASDPLLAAAEDSWQGAGSAVQQPLRSASLDKLQQQQQQRPLSSIRLRWHSILSSGGASAAAASLAQQALQAARRRSSQCSDQGIAKPGYCDDEKTAQRGHQAGAAAGRAGGRAGSGGSASTGCSGSKISGHKSYAPGTPDAAKQQKGLYRCSYSWHTNEDAATTGGAGGQQVQPLVVDAVRRLRNQVVGLQQQLAEADAGSRGSDTATAKLRHTLQELREQHDQLCESNDQLQHDKLQLQSKCRQLGLELQEKEQELGQAQVCESKHSRALAEKALTASIFNRNRLGWQAVVDIGICIAAMGNLFVIAVKDVEWSA